MPGAHPAAADGLRTDLQKEADDDIYDGFNNPAFRPQVDTCVVRRRCALGGAVALGSAPTRAHRRQSAAGTRSLVLLTSIYLCVFGDLQAQYNNFESAAGGLSAPMQVVACAGAGVSDCAHAYVRPPLPRSRGERQARCRMGRPWGCMCAKCVYVRVHATKTCEHARHLHSVSTERDSRACVAQRICDK